MDLSKHMPFQSVRLVGAVGIEPTTSSIAMEARSQLRHRPTIEDKKPTPAKSGSRQVPNSFSPLAFHADAPLYIPGATTRIPAELVTCEHICDST
jgi:hypothetical protein